MIGKRTSPLTLIFILVLISAYCTPPEEQAMKEPNTKNEGCDYPILEHDPAPKAIIEPGEVIQPIDIPEHCVICFFPEVLKKLEDEGSAKVIQKANVSNPLPILEIEYEGQRLAVAHPGWCSPGAAVALETLIAFGCKKFIVCGGSGVLSQEIEVGQIIVPKAAVRDEGTSYHYLSPGREVEPSPEALEAIENVLKAKGIDYIISKTWTTDSAFRETVDKVERRRAEGCLAVEMEAAAFFAVARFRGVTLAQILYAGDAVTAEGWDHRDWEEQPEVRESLFWLAVEACVDL